MVKKGKTNKKTKENMKKLNHLGGARGFSTFRREIRRIAAGWGRKGKKKGTKKEKSPKRKNPKLREKH